MKGNKMMNETFDIPIPSDSVMKQNIAATKAKMLQWWKRENKTPVLGVRLMRQNLAPGKANDYWPDINSEPNIEKMVDENIKGIHAFAYGANAYPTLGVSYGGRGTPMLLSFFLGATPWFTDTHVFYKPIIKDIKDFNPVFDPENIWLKRSLQIFKEQTKAARMGVLPTIPGLGDYLTNLAGLRGTQELIYDLVDYPQEIHRIREKMVPAFWESFKAFQALYPPEETGTRTWMAWSPGPNYPVQCDFCVNIGPDMFKEFVLPETEYLSQYLDNMCWHFDGDEQIRHLDLLLGASHIDAIQFQPRPTMPSVADKMWEPVIRKILDAGKGVIVINLPIETARQFYETYHQEPGIYIRIKDECTEENIDKIKRYFGASMW